VSSDRVVEVYEIQGRLVFASMAWWDDFGAWGSTAALTVLPADADDESAGRTLRAMFLESARLPVDSSGATEKALLKAAGVRSRSALVKSARYVNATERPDGSVLLVSSHRNDGDDGWAFDPPEQGLTLVEATDRALGAAVRKVVELSR
jgi:hypothetical protein